MSLFQKFGAYPESQKDLFQELYKSFFPIPYKIALGITKNGPTAEDIAQEVFEKAFGKLDTFQDQEHFCKWLTRTALCLSIDHYRNNRKVVLVDRVFEANIADNYLEHNPEPLYLRAEEEEIIMGLISVLKPNYRTVVVERLFRERSYKEIAREYNVSENLLRTRYHRALDILRKILETRV